VVGGKFASFFKGWAGARAMTRVFVMFWLVAALGWPGLTLAQAIKMPRIGILALGPDGPHSPMLAVERSLNELGYVDGKTATFARNIGAGAAEQLPALAANLVSMNVDVIVAFTNASAFAAKGSTSKIPIVVWGAKGAVESGLVASLPRPGGNITGVETLAPDTDAKRIQILKEIAPGLRRMAVLYNSDDQGALPPVKHTREAGRLLGIDIDALPVRRAEDLEPALMAATKQPLGGLLTIADDLTVVNWPTIATLAARHRVPTMCQIRRSTVEGCLVSYGTPLSEFNARVASQVDRIIKGAKPAELPFERATRFELVVNMSTAKSLGITVPQTVLLRADEVIP
jgi:putative ABC transport system substrate-binding protein